MINFSNPTWLLLTLFVSPVIWANSEANVITPPSSKDFRPGYAHTNIEIYKTPQQNDLAPSGETPSSMACVYNLVSNPVPGCPINGTSTLPSTGSQTIALVDAYDLPTAEADLNVFSQQFGLPACTVANGCFSQVYAQGAQPAFNAGWASEIALDIEWAHAMAPHAKILLVEADDNSNNNLFDAVQVATTELQQRGGGELSMSWGGAETVNEQQRDRFFQNTGIIYLASSGDDVAPTSYPAASSYVIAAGGTTINRDQQGLFTSETVWSKRVKADGTIDGTVGGPSTYITRPTYQNSVSRIAGSMRGIPDIAFNANPTTGVSIYVTNPGDHCNQWCVIGGTSVSSPALAGIINSANSGASTTTAEHELIYNKAIREYHDHWNDILVGNNNYPALPGYDFCTGLGSPRGFGGL